MRPLRLELEGFTAFRDHLHLDLTELDLFAITGPTGAGKSSLIDAIVYALYGRVPRVGASIGSCISQGLSRMWVQLEFEAGADRYCVFRETKKTGQRAIRLDHCENGEWKPLQGGAAQVNAQIERIVGLDFDGFTRSVLLPQGQFQEFLAGDPAKRREVLAGLLQMDVYEGIRRRAAERASEARIRMRAAQDMLDTVYADVTPEAVQLLGERLQGLRKEESVLGHRAQALSIALDLAREISQTRAQLDAAREQLRDVATRKQEAEVLATNGADQLSALEAALQEVETTIESLEFDPGLLTALQVAHRIHRDLTTTTDALGKAQGEVSAHQHDERGMVEQEASLSTQLIGLDLDHQVAREAVEAAQATNAAAVVQATLQPGQTCPVCGGCVGDLPHIDCPDLEEGRRLLRDIENARQQGQQALAQLQAERQVAATRREEARSRAEQLKRQIADLAGELAQTLPGDDWSAERVASESVRQQAAQRSLSDLEGQRRKAEAAVRDLQNGVASAQATLSALEGQEEACKVATSAADGLLRERLERLREQAKSSDWGEQLSGLDAGPPLERRLQTLAEETETARRATQNQLGQLDQQLQDLRRKMEQKQQFQKELAELKSRFDVADDLAKVMQANRFGAFVQTEALQLLAEGGSRSLETLSAGRYRLQVAGSGQDFEVVDTWNGDEARSVKTLSGGETFLASLALALTMAESLPGLAATQRVVLDSIIIDEGFGSLDSEALDRAADALDALRSQNRLVCVITHLKELADRLPARVIVHKSETGSTISVV